MSGAQDMITNILGLAGGLGLFLLGMTIMTDGLKGLAGNALRRALARFTNSPVSGAASGAVTTAIIQSSSATTLATIGFVGAGLMTFPQALGVVFGANIGTTITGWLVALLGFKLSLDTILYPAVFIGVLMRLFGGPKLKNAGWTLAGFGLLFVGIGAMQQGMAGFQGLVTPESFPPNTIPGRLQLLLIGMGLTIVTQSSSAGVATALVALDAGAISFPQAAAMVIGMDVGTTFTAAVAVLGGNTAMRRTGYAHVVYNVMTGIMAFFLLTPYTAFAEHWLHGGSHREAQLALVAFHTLFNTLGVLLILGFTTRFAGMIERLVPERGPPLVDRLERKLLQTPDVAVEAATATIADICRASFQLLADTLRPDGEDSTAPAGIDTIANAHAATLDFVRQIKTDDNQPAAHRKHVAAMHALDHLERLINRCRQSARTQTLRTEPRLRHLSAELRAFVTDLRSPCTDSEPAEKADALRSRFREERHVYRQRTLMSAAHGNIDSDVALDRLDAVRWLHRVAYHVWRILYHLQTACADQPPADLPAGTDRTEPD